MTAITDKNGFMLYRSFLSDSFLSFENLSTINLVADLAFRQTKSIKTYKHFMYKSLEVVLKNNLN